MSKSDDIKGFKSVRDKFLGLSLESTRKSYYPQLQEQLETIRENERRLRLLTDNLPARISYIDHAERYIFVNREYARWLGLKRRQIMGQKISDVLGPDNYANVAERVRKALGGYHVRFEMAFTSVHGQSEWLEIQYVPDVDAQGNVAGFYAMIYDLTDRKRAEAALQESEEQYRLLFQNANDAIFIVQDGKIKFPNPKTLQILGSRESLESISFTEFIHSDDRAVVLDIHRRRLAGESDLPTTYTFRVINSAGKEYAVQLSAVKIQWEGRPATLNFVRDVTEMKKLEANLRQAQKMEAVGTLAGGIAHDFNNLLMGIQGRVSLMMADKESSDPDLDHLEGIQAHVKSATELTRQLLGFARGGKYEIKSTNMNLLLEQSSEMFGRTRKEIRIIKKLEPDLWAVEVDRGQINQVLLNLYVNAWQAMPNGGELYIETENMPIDENLTPLSELSPGKYVKTSITDTGVGMDETIRSRIFDPFFTTKEMGRGTGLGLASSYGIIKNHNGAIRVYSEIGKGSTFTIYLPASTRKIEPEEKLTTRLEGGDQLILMVDDETLVLEVGEKMLEKLGYRVLMARSGQEALEIFERHRDQIDLIILDMVMPDMGGSETFDKIRDIKPDANVLLSSGYSLNGQAIRILNKGCRGFIQKPFSLHELSQKLKEIL